MEGLTNHPSYVPPPCCRARPWRYITDRPQAHHPPILEDTVYIGLGTLLLIIILILLFA